MSEYTVVINGKPEGPYSLEGMKEIAIRPGTFVRTPGMDDYKEAHEIPELRALLGFKERTIAPQYFAALDIRLLAAIIDYGIILGVYLALAAAIVLFIDQRQLKIVISVSGLSLIPVIKLVYGAIMEASARQGTFGKALLELKVSDESGSRISLGRAATRNLCKILSGMLLGLGYMMGFFNKKQQCLHDTIAGTLVIRDRLI